jgi:hypothetical protein
MEGKGDDFRSDLFHILDDIEVVILNPLDAQVYDLGWITVLLKIVRQGEDAYGEVIYPDEIAEWFIPVIEFGGVYEHAIKSFLIHGSFLLPSRA